MEEKDIYTEPNELVVGPNAKAHIVKRLLAGLFDAVIMFFATILIYTLVSFTPIANTYNEYKDEAILVEDRYKIQTGYGKKQYIETVDANKGKYYDGLLVHYDEDVQLYYVVKNVTEWGSDEEKDAVIKNYTELVTNDNRHSELLTYMHIHAYLLTAVLSGGVVELLCMFVVPVIKSNGQTPGMWICGIRMISTVDYEKPKWYQYLFRFLFMFVIESLVPYFFIGRYIILAVPIVLIIVMVINKKNKTIHDFVGRVMVIEKKTFIQSKTTEVVETE